LKKLRYALEVFNEARAHDDAHMMALLRKMQQTLGRLHDLEMLAKRVRSTEAHAESTFWKGWRHSRKDSRSNVVNSTPNS
jgi:CHAD domain-containing protein